MGLVGSPGTPEVDASMHFADLVKEKSNGEYCIDILHSGQAGGEREIAEGLQYGTMDMAVLGGILQNFDPALMIVEWDLLFKNNDHVRAVMNGPIGEKISQRIVDNVGARKIATFMRSPRLLTTKLLPLSVLVFLLLLPMPTPLLPPFPVAPLPPFPPSPPFLPPKN